VADAASHIQIVADGSSNIGKIRVENTSFLVDGISYYWNSVGIGAIKAGASWIVKNVIKGANEITRGSLNHWTAFSSDTCNTQRRVWSDLIKDPDASHVLSVPCDSHGIQLIFKDLLFPGKDLFQNQIVTTTGTFFKNFPNKIVSAFSKSDKQLAYLREAIKKCGGIIALITTVPTRWGTQVRQIASINRSSEALKAYAERPDDNPREPIAIKSILHRNNDDWQKNKALEQLLEPIHTYQKMSESNHSILGKVYPRWMAINAHFQIYRVQGSGPWWEQVNDYCIRIGKGGWTARMEAQLQPIHLVAYMLLPENHGIILTNSFAAQVDAFILERLGIQGFHEFY
jgi:hypothetical protein